MNSFVSQTGNFLILDTSSTKAGVALYKPDYWRSYEGLAEQSHSEETGELISKALSEAQLKIADLVGIILGSGPGSFTGLRIGYALAKGLSQGSQTPILQVPSFSGMVSAYEHDGLYAVIRRAGRGEFFCAWYIRSGNLLKVIVDCKICKIEEIITTRNELLAQNVFESVQVLSDEVIDIIELGTILQPSTDRIMQGLFKASLVVKESVKNTHDLALIEPLYLRAVQAKSIVERAALDK